MACAAVAGVRILVPAVRDGGRRQLFLPVSAGAVVDPTDAECARATTRRGRSPHERLRMAVLFQALQEVRRHPPETRDGAAVREWFASDDAGWPCSFVAICDVLGLDPGAVRAAVLEAPAAAPPVVASRRWLHAAGH